MTLDIKPIRNRKDYEAAVAEIERLMDGESAAERDRLEVLATLVTSWQKANRPLASAKPIDAIKAAIDDRGLTRADLARAIGSESKVSEVLAGKRGLSTTMIAALHREFDIPLRSLIDMDARPKPRGKVAARSRASARAMHRKGKRR